MPWNVALSVASFGIRSRRAAGNQGALSQLIAIKPPASDGPNVTLRGIKEPGISGR